ncbi:hypothetical protein C8Q70DRAFT_597995 [Cubamyces menziesii]|nr:hypothetical protein C8Q70DRAFT_597995 [Cubamyces menziesii]
MDVFSTAYKATWESDIIASATARIIDWVDDDAREWFDRLVKIDTFHFGEFQEHFTYDQRLQGSIFYGYLLLCMARSPSIVGLSCTGPLALSGKDVQEQFLACLRRLSYFRRSQFTEAQAAWILAAHEALHAPKLEEAPHSDSQEPSLPPRMDLSHWSVFDTSRLHLFGRIMDGGELPEAYNDILMRSMEKYTSLALRTLRGKDYSKDKPLKNLGVYMRAHAILLHVFTIRSLQDATGSGTRSASLEGDVKTGLLSLSATLDLLADAFAARDVEDRIGSVEEDIIRPISHIVHAISHQFSPLRSLLPPDFCINLQKFISAFRKSAFSDRKFWIYVPWKEEEWKPLDLCATAQKLSKKLSSTVVRPSEAHENDSLDASSSYHTAHQSETVSEPPSPTVRAPLEDAHLTFDTAKHEEHPDRSEGDPWTYPDDGMLLPVPRESYQF